MIGTLADTIGNLIVFIYVGCLIWLWRRPAKGILMPLPDYTKTGDDEPEEGGDHNASGPTR